MGVALIRLRQVVPNEARPITASTAANDRKLARWLPPKASHSMISPAAATHHGRFDRVPSTRSTNPPKAISSVMASLLNRPSSTSFTTPRFTGIAMLARPPRMPKRAAAPSTTAHVRMVRARTSGMSGTPAARIMSPAR